MQLPDLHARLRAVVPLLASRPDLLDASAQDSLIGLMVDFAAEKLSGDALALAQKLVRDDDEAREIYHELTSPPTSVSLPELAKLFTTALREFYIELTRPILLAAGGDQEIREQILPLGDINCILRFSKRPDGQFNTEFVIPEGGIDDPAVLSQLAIKVVDRPHPLVFQRRRSGNLVATQVLPATIEDAAKQIVIVSRVEPS